MEYIGMLLVVVAVVSLVAASAKYRPPSFKPRTGGYQANLERRFEPEPRGRFNSNAHIDLLDP